MTVWKMMKLGDCLVSLTAKAKVQRGWSPQCLSQPVLSSEKWAVLKTTAVQMGSYEPQHNKELPSKLEPKSHFEVQSGDFLMTTTGPRNRCGVICYVKSTPPKLIFSGKILRFRANGKIVDPRWIEYVLLSPKYQAELDALKVGTSDSSVSIGNEQVLDLSIPVPSLNVQKRILEALDGHLSRLDKALDEVELGREKEKLFKLSLLHALFENLDGEVLELGEISKPKYGKDVPKHLRGQDFPYPVVGSAGVMTYTEVPLVNEPSVLVGRKGNVGAVQMFSTPFFPVDTAYYLVCPEDVDLEFMYFQLQSLDLRSLDSSTTIPSLRRQDLEAVLFKKPNLATQQMVSKEIKEKLASIDSALNQLGTVSKTLSSLRRSILNAAFSGNLVKEVE
jgi:restriction endonuclease S subunit